MRVIGQAVINKAIIKDPIGGGEIVFFYRTPTTDERQQYNSSLFQARRGKVKSTIAQARQRFGKIILTGFREGDFVLQEGEQRVIFSSDPQSANYRESWKDLVMNYASDLVETLAFHVFEGASVVPDSDEEEDGGEDGDGEPLKNFPGRSDY
jgi:hypothetical protein